MERIGNQYVDGGIFLFLFLSLHIKVTLASFQNVKGALSLLSSPCFSFPAPELSLVRPVFVGPAPEEGEIHGFH